MPIPNDLPWMRVQLFMQNDEREWQNVFWYRSLEPLPGGFDAKANAQDIFDFLNPEISDTLQVGFAEILGAKVSVNNTTYTTVNDIVQTVGGNEASAELPTEVCVIAQAQAAVAGPSGKGRIFFSGVCVDNTLVSRLSSAGQTLYQLIIDKLNSAHSNGAGTTWHSVIYSRFNNAFEPILFWELSDVLCHRKKRRPPF